MPKPSQTGMETPSVVERCRQLLKRVGRQNLLNFSSYFVSKALSLGLFAIAVSYFIRRNGDHLYGMVTLILLLCTYLQMVDLGMGYAVVYRLGRAVARKRGELAGLVARTLPIYLASALVIGGVIMLCSRPAAHFLLGSEQFASLFVPTALGVGCLIASSLCVAVMQAYNRVYLVNFSRLVFDVVKAIALIVAAATNAGLATVLWLTLAGAVLKLTVDIHMASRLLGTFAWLRPVFSWRAVRLNVRLGAPMFSSSLIFSLISSLDKVLVAKLLSPAMLAAYSIATDLHAKAYFLLWAVTGSLYTPFIQRQARRESVFLLVLGAGAVIAGLFLVYFIPLAVFGHDILTWWINGEIADTVAPMLRWLLLPTGIYMVANLMEVFLQTAGETKRIGWAYLLALGVQLAGLSTLPERFGVVGVIWAVALMHFSLLACFAFLILKRHKARLAKNSLWTSSLANTVQ